MQSFIKSKARLYAALSVIIISQCCCCILPVGWQIYKESPAVRQTVERIDSRLNELPAVSAWLDTGESLLFRRLIE